MKEIDDVRNLESRLRALEERQEVQDEWKALQWRIMGVLLVLAAIAFLFELWA